MKTGISTAAFYLRRENDEAFSLLKELGSECTEMFFTSFSEYDPAFSRSILPLKGEIEVHSVHILTSQIEPQFFNPHPKVRMDAYYFLEKTMRSAALLGAKYYTFHGITRAKRAARSGENDNFERVGRLTAELCEFCKKFGVTLCQENVEWAFYNRPGVYRKLKEQCPGLKGVLDLKQARLSGFDWREYLREMGGDIAHVHVTDVDGDGKMCLPGKGKFPFRELVARLKDEGFDGPLLIEPYSGDYRELSELSEAEAYLRSLL